MAEFVLQTTGLSKSYKNQFVLSEVNLAVRTGSIYGLIGQNGAGKSSLIRIVSGLVYPNAGSIELFGQSDGRELVEARKRIGVMIEAPALYPHLNAEENLEIARLLKGVPGKANIGRLIELVGLQGAGRKKTRNFSMGMKQRLAIAIAMLGDPELLILDEPINGLDPMGVAETRQLLQKLNREYGITMLISSHILSELHLLATDYGILHKGKLLEQLTSEDLAAKCRKYLRIEVDNPEKAATVIETKLSTNHYEVLPDGAIRLYQHIDNPGRVSTALVHAGLVIEQFVSGGHDLETYFFERIGGERHE